jgi:hypothetical protein
MDCRVAELLAMTVLALLPAMTIFASAMTFFATFPTMTVFA